MEKFCLFNFLIYIRNCEPRKILYFSNSFCKSSVCVGFNLTVCFSPVFKNNFFCINCANRIIFISFSVLQIKIWISFRFFLSVAVLIYVLHRSNKQARTSPKPGSDLLLIMFQFRSCQSIRWAAQRNSRVNITFTGFCAGELLIGAILIKNYNWYNQSTGTNVPFPFRPSLYSFHECFTRLLPPTFLFSNKAKFQGVGNLLIKPVSFFINWITKKI